MRVTNSGVPSWNPTPSSDADAASGEALGLGDKGPGVKELQQLLNAAGAHPALEEDGSFGPKTQAALQKATGASVLDAAAKATLSALASAKPVPDSSFSNAPAQQGPVLDPGASMPTAHTAATGASGAPAGSVAAKTLEHAYAEEDSINPMKRGDDGNYKGWDKLQTIFEQTTGWKPTDKEVQHIEPGHGASPGGKSWCGIWACHILQESGVNVKWDLTKGEMVGDVTHVKAPLFTGPAQYKAERAAFEQSIRPGDVITVSGKLNHHAIVTKVNPDGTVETMDGNKPHVGRGHQKLADVTSYYRPNAA